MINGFSRHLLTAADVGHGPRRSTVAKACLPLFGFKVSGADVADYMVRAVETPALAEKVVGVSG